MQNLGRQIRCIMGDVQVAYFTFSEGGEHKDIDFLILILNLDTFL